MSSRKNNWRNQIKLHLITIALTSDIKRIYLYGLHNSQSQQSERLRPSRWRDDKRPAFCRFCFASIQFQTAYILLQRFIIAIVFFEISISIRQAVHRQLYAHLVMAQLTIKYEQMLEVLIKIESVCIETAAIKLTDIA